MSEGVGGPITSGAGGWRSATPGGGTGTGGVKDGTEPDRLMDAARPAVVDRGDLSVMAGGGNSKTETPGGTTPGGGATLGGGRPTFVVPSTDMEGGGSTANELILGVGGGIEV